MRTPRRSIMIPDPLWDALDERALVETERRGHPIDRSTLAREFIEKGLGIDYRQNGGDSSPYAELAPDRLDADNKEPAKTRRLGPERREGELGGAPL